MKRKSWQTLSLTALLVLCFSSCQEWGLWDEVAGGQKQPKPTVDASYANVSDPTLAKDAANYYIISSNATIDGITYQKGLMVRKSADLVTIQGMSDDNAYVLSDVVDSWAAARIKELDPTVEDTLIKIGQPCLRKVGSEWRLYYSVSGGTKASVIGYAVAASAEGSWTDKGEILSSTPTSTFRAYGPSFCTSIDGSKQYLAYGNGSDGVFVSELDVTTGKPTGTPTLIASRTDASTVQNVEMFTYGGYYHIVFTHYNGTALPMTCHAVSTSPTGPYKDFSGRNSTGIANFWEQTRILTNHQLAGSKNTWEGITGIGYYQDNDQFFVVHQATTGGSEPTLHIRKMHWLMDSRRVKGTEIPVPAIEPERYFGETFGEITEADIVGSWNFGTLWGHVLSGITDPMTFNAGGTYDGGSWDFNPATHILHLKSTEWGGENIYLYLSKAADWDNDKAITIVGSGANDTFGDFPGVWMKKVGTVSNEVKRREGVFAPTIGKEGNLYWIISGNAKSANGDYSKGLVVQSSSDLLFYDDKGFILNDVVDGWAKTRMKELNPNLKADAALTIDYPCLRKVGTEWRLYYSVSDGTRTSVIGYATATTLGGTWIDKGEVLASDSTSAYRAVSPSFCASPDNSRHYLAFGDGVGGAYITELNATTGKPTGTTVRASMCGIDGTTNQRVGFPELFYYNGYYHLYTAYSNLSIVQSASTNPMGPYYSYANNLTSDGATGFNEVRIMTPYFFTVGGTIQTKYSYNYGGINVFNDDGSWFVTHQGQTLATESPSLYVRELNWINDDRRVTSQQPFPAIAVERFVEKNTANITTTDLTTHPWHYGTLWYQSDATAGNKLSDPIFTLNTDGTISGAITGTWDYNETTHILRLIVTPWGGEKIFVYVSRGNDWDRNSKACLIASGVNDSFSWHPGVWMKQIPAQ